MDVNSDLFILGVMSGSSLDGLDLAICNFKKSGEFNILAAETLAFPDSTLVFLRSPLDGTAADFIRRSSDFTKVYARMIESFLARQNQSIDLIVSHGHTILHEPDRGLTTQIGNGGWIAALTGIDTLSDLRIQDVAIGGQGAPLAALVDRFLFGEYRYLLNLGGIANISVNYPSHTLAWDVSPCNQSLNALAVQLGYPYDDKGRLAAAGEHLPELYEKLRKLPYFSMQPPKSMDNQWIKEEFNTLLAGTYSVEDRLHTVCSFISSQLVNDLGQYTDAAPGKLLITGGGAFNHTLTAMIGERCKDIGVNAEVADPLLIAYKEALLMAFMGYRYLTGQTNTVASATGAAKDLVAGAYYRGNG